ncbi:dipeptidase [Chondrinema litorale]|uniref:dipeptidase n=1 Tax=Chondrinema litorale TaxID=2994555 RepID=UPI002542A21D|nr:membrane dipeptidase [Chondrinema litorale]UZR94625.1 membrane dipeptidase [Chondrinema litorale]
MFPVIDFHCDLLSYLVNVPGADALNSEAIGCALPNLKSGDVKLQVLAVFTATNPGSVENASKQFDAYEQLCTDYKDWVYDAAKDLKIKNNDKAALVPAIENASGILEEDESLDLCFERLDVLLNRFNRLLYITITHHSENRFGGGNYSDKGLKDDGKQLLKYLDSKQIAVDLSHTSDQMAFDILNTIDQSNLNVPVIASHSNMRAICDHPRNLPDELIEELKRRNGFAGVNFVRAFLDNDNDKIIFDHIAYAKKKNLPLVFGADFFSTSQLNDPARLPYFFKSLSHAGQYPHILEEMQDREFSEEDCYQLAFDNASKWLVSQGFAFE